MYSTSPSAFRLLPHCDFAPCLTDMDHAFGGSLGQLGVPLVLHNDHLYGLAPLLGLFIVKVAHLYQTGAGLRKQ